MKPVYLKSAETSASRDSQHVRQRATRIISKVEAHREQAVSRYSREVDGWSGNVVVPRASMDSAGARLSSTARREIRDFHDAVRRFAQRQLDAVHICEFGFAPGITVGQRLMPLATAGCYLHDTRRTDVAAAISILTTARTAGVEFITVSIPPRARADVSDAMLFAVQLCGANRVFRIGGAAAIAAMAFGLFGTPSVAAVAGGATEEVSHAKRILFGRTGCDAPASSGGTAVIATDDAAPDVVARDLVRQLAYGAHGKVRLVSDDTVMARAAAALVPRSIVALPPSARQRAQSGWDRACEIVVCCDHEQMADITDLHAPEHVQVRANDSDWWLERLRGYRSLTIGDETPLEPDGSASMLSLAHYPGGVSVHDFTTSVTWRRAAKLEKPLRSHTRASPATLTRVPQTA